VLAANMQGKIALATPDWTGLQGFWRHEGCV